MVFMVPSSNGSTSALDSSTSGSGRLTIPPSITQYKDGLVELLALRLTPPLLFPVPCEDHAVVVTKLSLSPGNGGCPPEWGNISCSCIESEASTPTNEWVFNLKRKSTDSTPVSIPTAIDPASTVLEVNTIGQFQLPNTVSTLRLLSAPSDTATKFDLSLISSFHRDSKTVSLIETETENFVKLVELAGIDLSNIEITEDFLPPSVTNLTLRNCNLDSLPTLYLSARWDKLLNVDMSGNSLSTWFGGEMAAVPQATFGTITTLNLSGNKYKGVPSAILGMTKLETFNFSRNPVTNMTVNQALFDKIAGLRSFYFDDIDTSSLVSAAACGNSSTIKTTHNVSFCVVSPFNRNPTAETSVTSGDEHTSRTRVVIGVVGTVLIAVLATALFLMHRKRRHESRQKLFTGALDEETSTSESRGFDSLPINYSSRTLSLGMVSDPGDPSLLSDPMIITSRLDNKELRFGELLKQGGFGIVFSGVYKRRRVAIKKIRSEFSMDAKLVDSFLKEIALMASLSHPRIVEYIGCAWDHVRNLSMVTELMTRGDLLQHYKHQRKLPLTWTSHKTNMASHKTRMALHIAEGLRYLHTLSPKVIHRDLKSKNVLVSDELEAKLTDFGISREGRFEQTHMTAGIGTSFWIAPEVLAGLRYDERADIFSFGVVLSEIDTDDYPYWNARSEQEGPADGGQERGQTQEVGILRMVLSGEMRPQFTSECPQAIRFLADRCLEGEPSKRPSANEIVEYLMAVISGPANE